MNWLQICLVGSFFSSFLPHSYGYEPANELKAVLNPPNFRSSPYSRQTPCLFYYAMAGRQMDLLINFT
ncbi:MAG: hypothetical protein DRH07_01690 [Deltaproteobacteria bacterium]|nr:MAG: hypothetical protein DRH07_01690 [Deltaproteobacteria bacterium]